jgi:phosphatidate cytidylyltransferase
VLVARLISGIILAPLFLLLVYLGAPFFNLLVAAIAAVMAWEFTRMDGEEGAKRRAWISAACVAAVAASSVDAVIFAWLIVLVATIVVVVADQVAGRNGLNMVQWAVPYVIKLAPAISPNKTWAGALGGLLSGTLAGLVLLNVLGLPVGTNALVLSIVVSVLTQIGDLFESALKRKFQVKDSGGLIPGHGGVMDRFDGLWAAAPIVALLCFVLEGGVRVW